MQREFKLLLVVGVVVMAFAIGRAGFLAESGPVASAQHTQNDAHGPSSADQQALEQFGSPSKHHRVLDALIGTFSGKFTVRDGPNDPPTTTHGTVTREWVLGGRFVRETITSDTERGNFKGIGYIGYDNFDGQYEMIWMDSTSTAMQFDTGNFHPDEKVMHVRESRRDPVTGRLVNAWSKLDVSDPDRHIVTGYATDPSGRTYKALEAVLERTD